MILARRLTLWVVLGSTVFGAWAEPPATTLAADQELTIQTLKRQLGDPKRSPETRLDAARLLLSKPYSQATQVLGQFLADSSNAGAQLAVAEALAEDGNGHRDFIQPLMAMLTGDEPRVRPSAARALVTYQNHGVTNRLIAVAQNSKLDRSIRRVTIEALQRIVARTCISALIDLLGDPDPSIRSAAAGSLRRMTNLRRFGSSRTMWQAWFDKHRHKDDLAWLKEMNDGLMRAKMSLEKENAQLRGRLIETMELLYNASSKLQRPDILLSFLNDPVGEVRLLGETLIERMIAANESIPPEVRQRVRLLLFDDDPRVRHVAAVLEANLADAKTIGLLLGRLRAEQVPDVRVGLLKALGQLKSPKAVPALLIEIAQREDAEASAAAEGLGRIVSDQPLEEAQESQAVQVLVKRYRQSQTRKNSLKLRESLLTALGALGHGAAKEVLLSALKDPAAVIRLVAVNGLSKLNRKDSAEAILPLVQDEDRGVRQAALAALIVLDGKGYLKTILRRTDRRVEPDPAVRKEAVNGVLAICDQADVQTLDEILTFLTGRTDARALQIQILQRKATVLKTAKSSLAPETLRQAGRLLLADGRANEAVVALSEAWTLLQADPKRRPDAQAAWLEYVQAMLASNSPAVVRAIREQNDPKAYNKALDLLLKRLNTLQTEKQNLVVLALADGAVEQLAKRLTETQKKQFDLMAREARKKQMTLDQQQVEKLLPNLLSADSETRAEAEAVLKAMGARAKRPLLEELKKAVSAATPDAEREKALYDLLKQIVPDLGPYDPAAEKAQRRAKIDNWLKTLK